MYSITKHLFAGVNTKEVEGLPPQNSSCANNGYWVRAAAYFCKVKSPTQRLAKQK